MKFFSDPKLLPLGTYRKAAMVIVVCGIIIGFGLGFQCGIAHSAEPQSAVIEFTSAEDLIARVDSVIGIVDTVKIESRDSGSLPDSAWLRHSWVDLSDTSTYEAIYYWWEIRHRRLVGVTVVKPLKYEYYQFRTRKPNGQLSPYIATIPGEAIVWWEWEKITEGGKQ